MAIVYRTNGAWGAGIGANLTAAQVDGNFYDLDQRVVSLETNPPDPVGVALIEVSNLNWIVTLTDSTVLDPIAIPVPLMRWRDDWAALTLYTALDQFRVNGDGIYAVLRDHTSLASFDALDGDTAVAAGSFVIGQRYIIATVGTTDFTTIGADANTVGTSFKATAAGSGTGTAKPQRYLKLIGLVDLEAGLSSLGDVNVTSIADKQYLRWDAATNKWLNTSAGYFTSFILESEGGGTFEAIDYGAASYADFTLRGANGTKASPSAILEDDRIGAVTFYGYDNDWKFGGGIFAEASENWTTSAHGTRLVFSITLPSTVTPLDAFIIFDDGGLSSGGLISEGLGTINVEGLFVHNRPVITQAADGSLEVAGSTLSGGLVPLTTGELDANGGPCLIANPDGDAVMVSI